MLFTVHFYHQLPEKIIIGNKLYQGHCIVGEISIGIHVYGPPSLDYLCFLDPFDHVYGPPGSNI